MARLLTLSLLALALVCAPAAGQTIATVPDPTPVAAFGGVVAWSVKEGDAYALMVWREHGARRLGVANRAQPFDVDLGTDRAGRIVATYTRCRAAGSPCRIFVADVATGAERAVKVPLTSGASDAWPSMWRGRVAFARRDTSHGRIDQVKLFDPARGRMRTLRHGAVPTRCPYRGGCDAEDTSATVAGLDLGARFAAFRWNIQAPAVIGHGGYEIRADRLSDGRSILVGSGFAGEVCTGGTDGIYPGAPSVQGREVWFASTRTNCYRTTVDAVRYDGFTGRLRSGRIEAEVLGMVRDGALLVRLDAPPPDGEESATCTTERPCSITRSEPPVLDRVLRRPRSPFF